MKFKTAPNVPILERYLGFHYARIFTDYRRNHDLGGLGQ